jgi:hypothetical protein
MERAKVEDDYDRAFKQAYSFSREKVTEYYNGAGALLSRDVKGGVHQPRVAAAISVQPAPAKTVVTGTPRNQHPALQGQSFNKNQLITPGMTNRFDFTLVGEETLDGRNMYVVDFAPAKKILPENQIQDRFINKAAGRVWIDTNDFAIAKADLHLTRPVDVAFGLIGSVWKFTYTFNRSRTDEGYWFTSGSSWHVEGREGFLNRTVTHTETITNVVKASSVATR